jgi:hypothetical protein
MKRIAVLIPIVAVAVLLAKLLGPRAGQVDFASRIAAMPDTSPPKWIYNNVTAIRANTDRILELLERQATAEPEHPTPAVPAS